VLFYEKFGLETLETFFTVNKPYVTLPMMFLTAGVGLVSGYCLHKGRIILPASLAVCTWAYLGFLKRRVAVLEGHRRFDEHLAVVCQKAFD
jgi:hypothetical protein